MIIDLGYNAIHPDCRKAGDEWDQPEWLEILSHISLAITALFLVEIPLTVWSLGLQWYNPWGRVSHAWLHLFDAVVIVATFVLEVILRGRDAELAALLVILRLWRIVKLVTGRHTAPPNGRWVIDMFAGVTVGIEEVDEERAKELEKTKEELSRIKVELASAQEQVITLQRRLNAQSNDSPPVSVGSLPNKRLLTD